MLCLLFLTLIVSVTGFGWFANKKIIVKEEQDIILECPEILSGDNIRWEFLPFNTPIQYSKSIYLSKCSSPSYNADRYKIIQPNQDLYIVNITASEDGWWECRELQTGLSTVTYVTVISKDSISS